MSSTRPEPIIIEGHGEDATPPQLPVPEAPSGWRYEERYGGGNWEWYPVEYPDDPRLNPHHDVPDYPEKYTDSELTEFFKSRGYNWLGPGTDIEYNLRNNVQPINGLDEIAMIHDLEYQAALDDLEHGRIDYETAKRRIWDADGKFVRALDSSWDVMSRSARIAMSAKRLYDWYFNTATYSYLKPFPKSDYFDEKGYEELPSYQPDKYNVDIDPYVVFGDPGERKDWVYTHYGWEKMDWDASDKRYTRRPERPKPYESNISVFEDRDRNGIPDILEKKKKRRRRHFQNSR